MSRNASTKYDRNAWAAASVFLSMREENPNLSGLSRKTIEQEFEHDQINP